MDNATCCGSKPTCPKFNRRTALSGAVGIAAAAMGYRLVRQYFPTKSSVFIARNQSYDGPLVQTITAGLDSVGFDKEWIRGRKVLLKPNLVEPNSSFPQITTHPSVVLAAADVFRRWGAEVTVGEGPGHVRDTEMALVESSMGESLAGERLPFVDLNYDDLHVVPNLGGCSRLQDFTFPRAVVEADLIVSIPKLKTHHWMGMTGSMKNLYGTLPGTVYGWPKNVLHYAGIPNTVVDIFASVPRSVAIVDGIICMEGDGPILGTAKPMGLLGIGLSLPAVDATLARIMGLDPYKVPYLALADDRVVPLAERAIAQRGEPWKAVAKPFKILDVPYLQEMRAVPGGDA
jgi:uncharacterized protein (DUF362 family)